MRNHTGRSEGLTFAGGRGAFREARVSEEALLTVLTVAALRVVAAAVTHAAAPPSRCEPHAATEVAAPGVTITLAPWVEVDTGKTSKRPCSRSFIHHANG